MTEVGGEKPRHWIYENQPTKQPEAKSLPARPGWTQGFFGVLLLIGGAVLSGWAFLMNTSVRTDHVYGLSNSPAEVSNLALMQLQTMILHTGLAMIIASVVLIIGGSIIKLMSQQSTPHSAF